MHQSHLATKLKQARLATGQSTRAVSERLPEPLRVSHATLTNYESGRSQPTVELLSVLAKVYDRPLGWFFSDALTLSGVRYRNRKSRVRQSDLARYEAHAVKWVQAYRLLERSVDRPLEGDLQNFRIQPEESGAAAAARLREQMDLAPDRRIGSVSELLDRLAIRAVELPTGLAIDGFAARAGEEYVVILNSTVPSDRARLNAAHEIGHVLAGDCDGDDIDNHGPNERRAFDFASHLLLTDEMLKRAFRDLSMVALVQFKERFGISVGAMIYRAQQSGLISERLAKQIWIQINKRGWKQNEPGHVAEDRAVRFERLLDSAILEERLTLEQAAELIGVRVQELRERHEWALGIAAWQPGRGGDDEDRPTLRLVC